MDTYGRKTQCFPGCPAKSQLESIITNTLLKKNRFRIFAHMEYACITPLQGSLVITDDLHNNESLLQNKDLYKFIWVLEGSLDLTIDHMGINLVKTRLFPYPIFTISGFPAFRENTFPSFSTAIFIAFSNRTMKCLVTDSFLQAIPIPC